MIKAWLCYPYSYYGDDDDDSGPEIKFVEPTSYSYGKIVEIAYVELKEKE